LGKSSITLAALKVLRAKKLFKKALVVAPLRVCYSVWPAEVEKWQDFAGFKVVVLHGKDKEQRLREDADLYVINPEGLGWLLDATKTTTGFTGKVKVSVDLKRWEALGFDTLIIDELSKFKHTNTQRFKTLKQVLPTFARRWGLTGSPAANGLMDLFGQAYVLDLGRSFGKYITHFRTQYFHPGPDGFSWVLNAGAEPLIYERLGPLALRMSAKDYLELPELVENLIKVTLPPDVMRIYRQVEDDFIAQVGEGTVVASSAAVASAKCRQVANGGVYWTDFEPGHPRRTAHLHDAKVDALEDLIEELQGQPLLVAYEFEQDLERIKARLGKETPHIGGGVSAKKAKEIIDRWNRGEIKVLLGHPGSIAHGVNLQGAAQHICWFAQTWNYEHDDQFTRRIWRQGTRATRVFVHRIIAERTIDLDILRALKRKAKGQEALFQAVKEMRERR
jgi:SNF2 family DNA or RNA helicase